MKRFFLFIQVLFFCCCLFSIQAQEVDLSLLITDGAGGMQELHFGIDSTATDSIDAALGEIELPPKSPAGVFDARFIDTKFGQGLARDYRPGSAKRDTMHTYQLSFQLGAGTEITLKWDLPDNINGVLTDIFGGANINQTMAGADSLVFENPVALQNRLDMKVSFMATSTGIDDARRLPKIFTLHDNYPNPFNPSTIIAYDLEKPAAVKLSILDVSGRHIRTLVDGWQNGGHYDVPWDGRDEHGKIVSSGVYFYRMQTTAASGQQTRKMLFVQ